jgi:hypothetical protein
MVAKAIRVSANTIHQWFLSDKSKLVDIILYTLKRCHCEASIISALPAEDSFQHLKFLSLNAASTRSKFARPVYRRGNHA